jgi:hypothetical protein
VNNEAFAKIYCVGGREKRDVIVLEYNPFHEKHVEAVFSLLYEGLLK